MTAPEVEKIKLNGKKKSKGNNADVNVNKSWNYTESFIAVPLYWQLGLANIVTTIALVLGMKEALKIG